MVRKAWVKWALLAYFGAGLLFLGLYPLVAWLGGNPAMALDLILFAFLFLAPILWFGAIMPLFATFLYCNWPEHLRPRMPLIVEPLRVRDAGPGEL